MARRPHDVYNLATKAKNTLTFHRVGRIIKIGEIVDSGTEWVTFYELTDVFAGKETRDVGSLSHSEPPNRIKDERLIS
ncbi:MAG: hypothetical protein J5482_03195 [Oscillospiraceae bacterium]|nr:hypothetical protein [Oscillospiraceae bacterium]